MFVLLFKTKKKLLDAIYCVSQKTGKATGFEVEGEKPNCIRPRFCSLLIQLHFPSLDLQNFRSIRVDRDLLRSFCLQSVLKNQTQVNCMKIKSKAANTWVPGGLHTCRFPWHSEIIITLQGLRSYCPAAPLPALLCFPSNVNHGYVLFLMGWINVWLTAKVKSHMTQIFEMQSFSFITVSCFLEL